MRLSDTVIQPFKAPSLDWMPFSCHFCSAAINNLCVTTDCISCYICHNLGCQIRGKASNVSGTQVAGSVLFVEIHTRNLGLVALRFQLLHLPWQVQVHQATNNNCQSWVRTGHIHGQIQDPEMIRTTQEPRPETSSSPGVCRIRWFSPDPSCLCQKQTKLHQLRGNDMQIILWCILMPNLSDLELDFSF